MATLALVVIGIVTAFFAFKTVRSARETLRQRKASVDFEAFVKACTFVDDEASFARSYAMVLSNAGVLKHAFLSRDRRFLLGVDDYDQPLAGAVMDVLATLERVATISHYATNAYATNHQLVDERTAEIVINAYESLAFVISELQQDEPQAFERFTQMYAYCVKRHGGRCGRAAVSATTAFAASR